MRDRASAPAGAPFLPAGGGFSNVWAITGDWPSSTGSDSIVVSGASAVAEGLGAGWSSVGWSVVLGAEVAVGDVGMGVAVGASGEVVAVAVATGVGASSATAGARPVVGSDARARATAANSAVFIRREFTFFFHETAAQPGSG
ncbi:hypothetical protein ASG71_05895 [Arthrobacter sp. Soil763]|nr:hypothetical protein ASG71_05895 [Arthrobacter sp. Soil763]